MPHAPMTARTLTLGSATLPGRAAQHPRPAAARRGGDHHDPHPGPGRARLRRQRSADPGRDHDLRRDRGRAHVPPDPRVRLAGQRDAHRQRRGADPARRRHAAGRPLDDLRAGGSSRSSRACRCCRSTSSSTAARTSSTRRTSASSSRSSCSARRAWSRSTSGGGRSSPGDAAGLRRDPGRRPADHAAAQAARARRVVLGRARGRRSACSPRRATA